VNAVLFGLDSNGDGVITVDELEKVGLDGLPNFDSMGAEGHHYDIESGMSHHVLLPCVISVLRGIHPHRILLTP
jgi:hypothetical protein